MLWLTWYPLEYSISDIRPIFRNAGFELQSIGPSFILQPQTEVRAKRASLEVNRSAAPDLLLRQQTSKILLPLECKTTSFGPDSTNKKQAYVFLSTPGSFIASSIGLDIPKKWESHVIYAVSSSAHLKMMETLRTLSEDLNKANIPCNTSSSLGIEVTSDHVYLEIPPNVSTPITELVKDFASNSNKVEVLNFEGLDDPSLLSIIPVDPTIELNDPTGIEILERKIRASITATIGSLIDNEDVVIPENEIMKKAIPVWCHWEDTNAKRSLMKHVRKYIRRILAEIRKDGVKADYRSKNIILNNITPDKAVQIRKYLTSSAFRTGEIEWEEDRQMGFDDLFDDWN